MAWPFDRLFSYITGSPVRAADLNSLQDAIIEDRSPRTITVLASCVCDTANWTVGAGLGSDGRMTAVAGSKEMRIPIPLREGDRITSWTAYGAKADGSGNFSATITLFDPVAGSERSGTTKTQTASGAIDGTLTESGLSLLVANDESVFLRLLSADAGDYVKGVRVTFDRP